MPSSSVRFTVNEEMDAFNEKWDEFEPRTCNKRNAAGAAQLSDDGVHKSKHESGHPSVEGATADIDEVFPIKFSLLHELKDDASFSEYVKDAFPSPGARSPMRSPVLSFGMRRSPLLSFGMSGFKLYPSNSLNDDDDLDYDDLLESPPSIRKGHNDHSFVNNLFDDEVYKPAILSSNDMLLHDGGPEQILSPGRTIYYVASRSVESPSSFEPDDWRPPSHHSNNIGIANSSQNFGPPSGNTNGFDGDITIDVSNVSNHKRGSDADESDSKSGNPTSPSSIHLPSTVSDDAVSPLAPTLHHPFQRPEVPTSMGGWSDSLLHNVPPTTQPTAYGQKLPPALPSTTTSGYYHNSTPYYTPSVSYNSQHYQAYQYPAASRVYYDPRSTGEENHWRKYQHLLQQFLLRFNHCNVPQGYGVGTHYEGLYQWCAHQRSEYQRMSRGEGSTMTPHRVQILTSMGFIWGRPSAAFSPLNGAAHCSSSNGNDLALKFSSSWSKYIDLLTEYKREHGNCDVPVRYEPNHSLGTFVNRQRTEYRKLQSGKPSSLTQQRVDELNRLGFAWTVRESHSSWMDRFTELKEFRKANGHCNVPKVYTKNPNLGSWVQEQRFQHRRLLKGKSTYLTDDKIKALEDLDFKWCLRETNGSWDNWLKTLSDYKDQHGDVDVPLKYHHNQGLGAFVNRQRTEYRKLQLGLQTSLTEERIQDLNDLGFKWSIRVSRTPWETRLDELIQYKEQHGHCNVPSTYPKNQPLAYWVFKQRGQYRIYMERAQAQIHGLNEKPQCSHSSSMHERGQLCHMSPERIAQLNEIGFEWNPPRRIKL